MNLINNSRYCQTTCSKPQAIHYTAEHYEFKVSQGPTEYHLSLITCLLMSFVNDMQAGTRCVKANIGVIEHNEFNSILKDESDYFITNS